VELDVNHEIQLANTRDDERYERLLVITKGEGAEEGTLTEYLEGFQTNEKLFVYPISSSPYIETAVGSWLPLQLVLSSTGGCEEALQVVIDEFDSLEPVVTQFKSIIEEVLAIPDEAAGVVVDTLNATHLVPPVLSPVVSMLAKPSKIFSGLMYPEKKIVSALPKPSISTLTKMMSFSSWMEKKKEEVKRIASSDIPIRVINSPEDAMNPKEKVAREARMSVIENKLGSSKVSIGLSTSGGGMRAMISSCGFFTALKEMGVLDVTMYQCGLSGSTWSTSKWMNNSENPFVAYTGIDAQDCWSSDVDPKPFEQVDPSKLVHTAGIDVLNWNHFKHYVPLLVASRSLLKVYSMMLAQKMETNTTDYSVFQNKTLSGKFPIPLCTSAFSNSKDGLKFADFSPFEIGSPYTKTYFPMEFYQIESFQASLPPSINEFMAVWGSAFYARISEIIPDFPAAFDKVLGNLSFLPGAKVMNANYNRMDKITGKALPLANHKYLYYKDGGIASNTPMEPLLRPERKVNMIIVLDADSAVASDPFGQLVTVLPSIKNAIPANPTFPYVFPATKDYPTLVFIPLLKNNEYDPTFDPREDCGTLKFTYTEDDAKLLFGLSHYLTMQAKDTIWKVINSLQEQEAK